jgi:hypothetical protein
MSTGYNSTKFKFRGKLKKRFVILLQGSTLLHKSSYNLGFSVLIRSDFKKLIQGIVIVTILTPSRNCRPCTTVISHFEYREDFQEDVSVELRHKLFTHAYQQRRVTFRLYIVIATDCRILRFSIIGKYQECHFTGAISHNNRSPNILLSTRMRTASN